LKGPKLKRKKKDATVDFEEYNFKGEHAKLTYILDDINKAENINSISNKLYPGIKDVCHLWKSMIILNALHKQMHLPPRKWIRPTNIGPLLRASTNLQIILVKNYEEYKIGTLATIVCVIIKDKLGNILDPKQIKMDKIKPHTLEYFYNILIDKKDVVVSNVPRDVFNTFTRKDEKFMKNILSYRKKHKLVIQELESCFPIQYEK
jgi:hypothetical protein